MSDDGAERECTCYDPGSDPKCIVHSAKEIPPPGYLLCDGRAITRADYPELFDVMIAATKKTTATTLVIRIEKDEPVSTWTVTIFRTLSFGGRAGQQIYPAFTNKRNATTAANGLARAYRSSGYNVTVEIADTK